uniref:Uncharacterized protein n=1 Tax=Anguilla anguilla TaxID=7936 RepID=A0A0E9VR30_ANGAN
MMMSLSRT